MSSDADVAERNLKRGELERIRHLLQGLDKQQRRLEKLGVLSRAQNGEPSGILVEKKDDGAPGVHEGLSDITDADRRASAADQAVSNRAASAASTGEMSSDEDFAEWKRGQLERVRRLRQDLDKQQRRLENDGSPEVHEDFPDITTTSHPHAPSADQAVTDRASPPGRATALHQLPPSEHEGAAAARDSQVAHRAGGGGLAKFEMLRGVLRKQGVDGLRSSSVLQTYAQSRKETQLEAAKHAHAQHHSPFHEPEHLSHAVPRSCPLLCGGFSREHPFRRRCFVVFKSLTWRGLNGLAILINSISIAYGAEGSRHLWVDVGCTCLLALEIFVASVSIGFVGQPNTWLRCSAYHKVDLLVLITSLGNLGYSFVFGADTVVLNLAPLRLFLFFKVLGSLKQLTYVKYLVKACKRGAPLMATVAMLLVFIVLFFAALGLASFKDHPRFGFIGRCQAVLRAQPDCASDFSTNWAQPSGCTSTSASVGSFTLVASEEHVISTGYPFFQTCDVEKTRAVAEEQARSSEAHGGGTATADVWTQLPCLADDLVQDGKVVGRQECRYVARNATSLDGVTVSNSLRSYKYAHWGHLPGASLAVLQYVFPDAAYDVYLAAYYSNFDLRIPTSVGIACMTFLVSLLIQGIFVAVVTGTFTTVHREYEEQVEMEKLHKDARVRAHLLAHLNAVQKSPVEGSAAEHPRGSTKQIKVAWEPPVKDPKGSVAVAGAGFGNSRGEAAHWAPGSAGQLDAVAADRQNGPEASQRAIQEDLCARRSVSPTSSTSDKDVTMERREGEKIKLHVDRLLHGFLWQCTYNAVIIVFIVLLSLDRWDTSERAKKFFRLYYSMAMFFFLIELVALWLARDADTHSALSRIVPLSPRTNNDSGGDAKPPGNDAPTNGAAVDEQKMMMASSIMKALLFVTGAFGLWSGSHWFTHIQAFRIFWPTNSIFPVLRPLLSDALNAMAPLFNMLTFITIIVVCWSIVGRYIFGNDSVDFEDMQTGMFTLFQIFTGDSWSVVLYKVMDALEENVYHQVLGVGYVVLWFLFSNIVLLNLLVSVIVDSYNVTATVEFIQASGGTFGALISFIRRHVIPRLPRRITKALEPDNEGRVDREDADKDVLDGDKSGGKGAEAVGVGPAKEAPENPKERTSKWKSKKVKTLLQVSKLNLKGMPKQDGDTQRHLISECGFAFRDAFSSETFKDVVDATEDLLSWPEPHRAALVTGQSFGGGDTSHLHAQHPKELEGVSCTVAGQSHYTPSTHSKTTGEKHGSGSWEVAAVEGDEGVPANEKRIPPYLPAPAMQKMLHMSFRSSLRDIKVQMHLQAFENNGAEKDESDVAVPTDKASETKNLQHLFFQCSQSPFFQWLMNLSVLISCITLLITPPFEEESTPSPIYILSKDQLVLTEIVFNILFTVEFIVLGMAEGFVPYFRNSWHLLEVFILAISWADSLGLLEGYAAAKSLRMFRVLKPLRVIKRNRAMRAAVNTLIAVLRPMCYILVLLSTLVLASSCVAMGALGGRMHACSNPVAAYPLGKGECSGFYVLGSVEAAAARAEGKSLAPEGTVHTAFAVPNAWIPPRDNFDSLGDAFQTLWQCILLKWIDTVHAVRDVSEMNVSPLEKANSASALLFVAFQIISAFLGFNLVLAFVVDAYNHHQGVDKADKMFSKLLRQIEVFRPQHARPTLPTNRLSLRLRGILFSSRYTAWVGGCIVLSFGFMLANHGSDHGDALPDDHDTFEYFMSVQNQVFAIELFAEVLLALVALGPAAFFSKAWYAFDALAACGMAAGLLGKYYPFADKEKNVLATCWEIVRVMRAVRILRILTFLPFTRGIVRTTISCIPQLSNMLVLMVLVYVVIAAIAVQWFGMVQYGVMLGPAVNVETFPQAVYLCYSMAFGGEWHILLRDLMVSPPYCTPEGPNVRFSDCGSPLRAVLLIFGIKIFVEGMMLNLCIGLILDNFGFIIDDFDTVEDSLWVNGASNGQVERLVDVFCRFDGGTGYLPMTALRSFLIAAPRPIGFCDLSESGAAQMAAKNGEMREMQRQYQNKTSFLQGLKLSAQKPGKTDEAADLDGDGDLTEQDRALYKLIRAELNLMLREKQKQNAQTSIVPMNIGSPDEQSSLRKNVSRIFGFRSTRKKSFVAAVSFEEVLVAATLWRVPWMVPSSMRHQRRERVAEVIFMMHALVMKDFLRRMANRKMENSIAVTVESVRLAGERNVEVETNGTKRPRREHRAAVWKWPQARGGSRKGNWC